MLGLAFIVPLGDLRSPRALLAVLLSVSALTLFCVGFGENFAVLCPLLVVGGLTASSVMVALHPAALTVARRLYAAELAAERGGDKTDLDPFSYSEVGFSICPEQGNFLHALVRFARPSTVVEFATSLGFSSIYLASALKANGSGLLYGSELDPRNGYRSLALPWKGSTELSFRV